MNRMILFLILYIPFSASISQDDFKVYRELSVESENRTFQIGQNIIDGFEIMNNGKGKLFYERRGITRDEMSERKPVNIILRLLDLKGNMIKNITIDYNDIDIDMAQFSASCFGDRKFIVITVRYRFYIIDLEKYEVIGPFFPKLKGERLDAQSGSLNNIKLFDHDKYLFGIAIDNGIFCYNIFSLYNPIEITGYNINPIYKSSTSFFIDNFKDSLSNGIYVHNASNELAEIKYIFESIELKETYEIDNQYILLRYLNKENKLMHLLIDYKNGKILDNLKDKELINKLIKKTNQ